MSLTITTPTPSFSYSGEYTVKGDSKLSLNGEPMQDGKTYKLFDGDIIELREKADERA